MTGMTIERKKQKKDGKNENKLKQKRQNFKRKNKSNDNNRIKCVLLSQFTNNYFLDQKYVHQLNIFCKRVSFE